MASSEEQAKLNQFMKKGWSFRSCTKSDWNENDPTSAEHIENRPFYPIENVVLYSDVEVNAKGNSTVTGSDPPDVRTFEKGIVYTVTFDGKPYECELVECGGDLVGDPNYFYGSPCTILGNPRLAYPEFVDNGMPFAFWVSYMVFGSASYPMLSHDYVDIGTHTYSISIEGQQYSKIPDYYLPNTLVKSGDDIIVKSSTEGSAKKFKLSVDDNGTISATEIT